jgi:hypothetical protein
MWCSSRRPNILAPAKAISAPQTGEEAVNSAEDQAPAGPVGFGPAAMEEPGGGGRPDTTHVQPGPGSAQPHLPLALRLPLPPHYSSKTRGYARAGHENNGKHWVSPGATVRNRDGWLSQARSLPGLDHGTGWARWMPAIRPGSRVTNSHAVPDAGQWTITGASRVEGTGVGPGRGEAGLLPRTTTRTTTTQAHARNQGMSAWTTRSTRSRNRMKIQ